MGRRKEGIESLIPSYMKKFYEGQEEEKPYNNPPIPDGFVYVKGKWNTGYTIMNKKDGSTFVWIPVGAMESNSTEDGYVFDKKFGRSFFNNERNGKYDIKDFYDDALNGSYKSFVEKMGGFYISSYLASWNNNTISFVEGKKPFITRSNKIENYCKMYAENIPKVHSMAVAGANYDCLIKFFMMNMNNISEYFEKFYSNKKEIQNLTGTRGETYGIHDLGLSGEYTTEANSNFFVVRGLKQKITSRTMIAWRTGHKSAFRVVLYVEPEIKEDPFEKLNKILKNYERKSA